MFKRENILYKVGDILIVCWTDSAGINRQIRGRLIQVKTELKKDLKSATSFVISVYNKHQKGNHSKRFNFKLENDIYIEKSLGEHS